MSQQIAPSLAGCTVAMLPRYDRKAPSSRLRMHQFIPSLEQAGARVVWHPFFGERYLDGYFGAGSKSRLEVAKAYAARVRSLARVRGADLVWIEKETFPFIPGAAERAVRLLRMPYVVDYDDAIFHNYDQHPNPVVRLLLASKLNSLLRGAALVTAGNPYLAAYARQHGADRIEELPTVVDLSRYPVRPAPAGSELRVGWIGTPANARYLVPLVAALNRLNSRRPVRLVTIGAPAIDGLQVPHEGHAWSEESETALLSGIDVGVMPLPDAPWERGKCAYKLIQYMAAGRPVIASPVGMNVDVVTPEVGFLAEGEDQWFAALVALSDDVTMRSRMGEASRSRVEAHYSVAVVAPRLIRWFADLVGSRRRGAA